MGKKQPVSSSVHPRGREPARAYDEVDDRITIPLAATTRSTTTTQPHVLRSGIDKYRSLSGKSVSPSSSSADASSDLRAKANVHSHFKNGMVAAVRSGNATVNNNGLGLKEPPMERGMRLMEQKQYAAAIAPFTEAIDAASGSAQTKLKIFYHRGSCYLHAKKYAQAIEDLTHVIQLTPINAMLLTKRARAHAALKQHDDALKDYNEAISLVTGSNPYGTNGGSTGGGENANELRALYIARAKVFESMGDLRSALNDLNMAEGTHGGEREAELYYQRAMLRLKRDEPVLALQDLDRFMEIQEDWTDTSNASNNGGDQEEGVRRLIDVRLERAKLLLRIADEEELRYLQDDALLAAEQGESTETTPLIHAPNARSDRSRSALAPFRSKAALAHVERAVEDYTQILRMDTEDGDVLRLRGECYGRLERTHDALADFSAALTIDPTDYRVNMARAKFFQSQNKLSDAIDEVTHVLDENGFFIDALFFRATLYEQSGDTENAKRDYTSIVEAQYDAAGNSGSGGDVTSVMKRSSGSQKQQAIARLFQGGGRAGNVTSGGGKVTNDCAVHALLSRARLSLKMKEFDDAIADYRRIIEGSSKHVDAQIELQESERLKKEYEDQRHHEAVEWLVKQAEVEAGADGGLGNSAAATSGGKTKKKKNKKKKKKKTPKATGSEQSDENGDADGGTVEEELETESADVTSVAPRGTVDDEVVATPATDDGEGLIQPVIEAGDDKESRAILATRPSAIVTRDEAWDSVWEEMEMEEAIAKPQETMPTQQRIQSEPNTAMVHRIPRSHREDEGEEYDEVRENEVRDVESGSDGGDDKSERSSNERDGDDAKATTTHTPIREVLVDERYLRKRQKQLEKLRQQLQDACEKRDSAAIEEILARAERKQMLESLQHEVDVAKRVLSDIEAGADVRVSAKQTMPRAADDDELKLGFGPKEPTTLDKSLPVPHEPRVHDKSEKFPTSSSLVIRPSYTQALQIAEQNQQLLQQNQRQLQEKDAEIAYLRQLLAQSKLLDSVDDEVSRGDTVDMLRSEFPPVPHLQARADTLIQWMGPSPEAEEARLKVLNFVHRVLEPLFAPAIFLMLIPTGSFPMKTYLPTADLDVCLLLPKEIEPTWYLQVMGALCSAGTSIADGVPNGSPTPKHSGLAPSSGMPTSLSGSNTVRNVTFVNAEVRLVKCTIDNISVDLTVNRTGAIGALLLLDEMDVRVGQDHLLKKSLILIKSWCSHESSAYTPPGATAGGVQTMQNIIGASHGALSTSAVNTIVMALFNQHGNAIKHPLQALYLFLDHMAEFSWHESAMTLFGPVPLSLLATIPLATALQTRSGIKSSDPRDGDNGKEPSASTWRSSMVRPEDVDQIRRRVYEQFGVFDSSGWQAAMAGGASGPAASSNGAASPVKMPMFPIRACNIVDPLDDNNNLARSVSVEWFPSVKRVFRRGRDRLARLLLSSSTSSQPSIDKDVTGLDEFFTNCWRSYGRGDGWRPDLLVHPRQPWHGRPVRTMSGSAFAEKEDTRWISLIPEHFMSPLTATPPLVGPLHVHAQHPLHVHSPQPHHPHSRSHHHSMSGIVPSRMVNPGVVGISPSGPGAMNGHSPYGVPGSRSGRHLYDNGKASPTMAKSSPHRSHSHSTDGSSLNSGANGGGNGYYDARGKPTIRRYDSSGGYPTK
ncbi:hypothetical protein Poli38472_014706 [Pythium oligandrum]|uniref:Uncharacterized protein n=1 Tax=Pythium oligandrum TaxID=41045 RepID=A0A8K1CJS6_PYTOL|nr:hypothetical protein Poli38472_014706 [Pythium oligandrum]|eukprot:TMW64001.1 hypothetical protein Poli38472_014706 [Pythium oligandrum]